jgi:hypothetical protein
MGNEKLSASDNRGTEHFDKTVAVAYWMHRSGKVQKDPFILYTFTNELDAKAALLELPCIHIASDTGQMICTEFLIYGCYKMGEVYEAILCGDRLTPELWENAKASFEKHGGKLKNELKPELNPEKTSGNAGFQWIGKINDVRFVREDRQMSMAGVPCVYAIHVAPDEASAMAFLETKKVDKKLYYIVVETPNGNFCRDIDGIYKE